MYFALDIPVSSGLSSIFLHLVNKHAIWPQTAWRGPDSVLDRSTAPGEGILSADRTSSSVTWGAAYLGEVVWQITLHVTWPRLASALHHSPPTVLLARSPES